MSLQAEDKRDGGFKEVEEGVGEGEDKRVPPGEGGREQVTEVEKEGG